MIQSHFIAHHIVTQLESVKRCKGKRFKKTMMSLIVIVFLDTYTKALTLLFLDLLLSFCQSLGKHPVCLHLCSRGFS